MAESVARGTVLVTGGAGYVGGFTVRALVARDESVAVLDDLRTGHRENVPDGVPLLEVDLGDREAVDAVFEQLDVESVLHFAASAYVGESMRDPRKYWENNVRGSLHLFGACVEKGVSQVVFSSSCTVYGEPGDAPLHEDLPRAPVNPYGRSKATVESVLEDYRAAYGLRSYRLRYFNAAGGASDGSFGEDHDPETHLIPLAVRAAMTGEPLQIFGTDWPTPDGTCVRDYVHVEDLADAHVRALESLRAGAPGGALNLGTGHGASVRDVVAAVAAATGRPCPTRDAPRRAGDPASLVALPGRAARVLGWTPQRTSIDDIVGSAWAWHGRADGRTV